MAELDAMYCPNHPTRVVAGKCLSCGLFFCDECLVEHDNKLICAKCLAEEAAALPSSRGIGRIIATIGGTLFRTIQVLIGFILLLLLIYTLGDRLLTIPNETHDDSFIEAGE